MERSARWRALGSLNRRDWNPVPHRWGLGVGIVVLVDDVWKLALVEANLAEGEHREHKRAVNTPERQIRLLE